MSRQGGGRIQKVEVAAPVSGATTYVARPDFGKLGTKIRLLVNGFSIHIPEKDFMRYDVVLTPEKVPKEVTRKVMECWKHQPHPELGWGAKEAALAKCITYDGQKLMYSPAPVKGIGEEFSEFEIELDEAGNPVPEKNRETTRSRKFGLKIRRIKDVSMAALHQYLDRGATQSGAKLNVEIPYEAISALEVLFRQNPILRYTTNPSGRSFYGNEGVQALPEGLEVHYGWFQSLRSMLGVPAQNGVTYKQLMLNIDVAATSFYQSGPLIDVIAQFFRKRNINDCKQSISSRYSAHKLDSFLRNVNVEITYASSGGRRKYKIKGLAAKDAASTRIVLNTDAGSKTVSIRDYFKDTYNIDLQYPWLPCILAGGNDIQIPIELCMVKANQRYVKKINEAQGAEMIKVTAVRPPERQQRIMSGLDKLHGKNDEDLLKDWGVRLDKNMINVEGRILAAPPMAFGKGSQVPKDGQWAYDRGNGFVKPAVLRTWAVAVFASPNDVRMGDIDNFLGELGKSFSAHNIKFHWADSTDKMVVYAKNDNDFQGCLQSAKDLALQVGGSAPPGGPSSNKREVDFILCILKVRSTPVYNEIKRIAETELGIVTQCCLSKFIQKPNRGYFSNIVLKINTKLGGINSSIAQPAQLPFLGENIPTMVLGADVTHPPAGVTSGVSIAALVGSVDRMFCDYRAAIRVQTGRKEIIGALEDMICELLEHFTKQNRVAPRRVLFYRDGVSEGQFGEVVYNEVTAIKNAFERMKINAPTVTFLSVNKRHHIRFFATDRRNADRNGNLLAGTVIDTGCVHPYEFDFFLNSHPGLQGTSRPTHYHVLYDENRFSADSLQNLTYRLCFFYCRSTRVVSIVPAAYYSHLVAARARAHISTFEGSDTASQASGAPKNFQSMEATKVLEEVTQGMYFV